MITINGGGTSTPLDYILVSKCGSYAILNTSLAFMFIYEMKHLLQS